jgi:hypothetical protein
MIQFTKSINDGFVGQPYVEVDSNTVGAVQANNGGWYLTKSEVENRFNEGTFHLTFLTESDFIAPVAQVFMLSAHKAEIEAATDSHVDSVVRGQFWYKNEGELSIRSKNENKYMVEASQLSLWHIATYDALEVYLKNVTEANHLSIEQFMAILPNVEDYVQEAN